MSALFTNSFARNGCLYSIVISLSLTASTLKAQTKVIIHFENKVGNEILQPDSTYQNIFGETFTVRNFKYYISNISLSNSQKTQSFPDQYFLVDNTDSSSRQIELNPSLKNITVIKFLLGVDSLKN